MKKIMEGIIKFASVTLSLFLVIVTGCIVGALTIVVPIGLAVWVVVQVLKWMGVL